jgi:ketosteroid isomerase-like protein
MDPLDVLEAGDGLYVVELRLSGKGTLSGIEVGQSFAFLYTLRPDGKVVRARLFPDVSAAVSAAGSSEPPTPRGAFNLG